MVVLVVATSPPVPVVLSPALVLLPSTGVVPSAAVVPSTAVVLVAVRAGVAVSLLLVDISAVVPTSVGVTGGEVVLLVTSAVVEVVTSGVVELVTTGVVLDVISGGVATTWGVASAPVVLVVVSSSSFPTTVNDVRCLVWHTTPVLPCAMVVTPSSDTPEPFTHTHLQPQRFLH